MINIRGEYGTAKVFTDELDNVATDQIKTLMNQKFIKDSNVRIMPDVHPGMGSVIGFTADMGDIIIPNIVGVDIGCGMLTIKLGQIDIDLETLDKIIHSKIPSGFNMHNRRMAEFPRLQELHMYRELDNMKRIERSIGTLGGGNHFIGATCC